MNDLIMQFLKDLLRLFLWIGGGYLIGQSFSLHNSFSAEIMFTIGIFIAITGFFI